MEKVKISEQLAAFRERVPGCFVVVFADLSTGMVLASSSAEKMPQEKLDALCMDACDALKGVQTAAVAEAVFDKEMPAPDVAVQTAGETIKCFVRPPEHVEEALCFTLVGAGVSKEVIEDASAAIRRFSSETT